MERSISVCEVLGVLAVAAGSVSVAAGQGVVNGDFESNSLLPWVVTDTPQGRSYANGVYQVDIDQAGPLGVSRAAGFIVGQRTPNSGLQGIEVTQPVMLAGGSVFRIGFDWQVHALVSFHNASGGKFELIVNGVVLNQASASVLMSQTRASGHIEATFTPPAAGIFSVGVRITRTVPAGEEQLQFIDNYTVQPVVPTCRADFNNSGGVSVQDIFDFLGAYFAGLPSADFNNSGGAPTVQDIFDFLSAYFAGCL